MLRMREILSVTWWLLLYTKSKSLSLHSRHPNLLSIYFPSLSANDPSCVTPGPLTITKRHEQLPPVPGIFLKLPENMRAYKGSSEPQTLESKARSPREKPRNTVQLPSECHLLLRDPPLSVQLTETPKERASSGQTVTSSSPLEYLSQPLLCPGTSGPFHSLLQPVDHCLWLRKESWSGSSDRAVGLVSLKRNGQKTHPRGSF